MHQSVNAFYLKQVEPERSLLLAIRNVVLSSNMTLNEAIKYGMPFFYYKSHRICYIWRDKKAKYYYLGFTDGFRLTHPSLVSGDRKRIKILPLEKDKNLPVNLIHEVLIQAVELYH